jgi:dihydropteroate synthase
MSSPDAPPLRLNGRDIGPRAIMAVVNRTPDSFYDRGATFALDRAVEAALAAVDAGADWIDIGGVPFGRGPAVSTAEEIARVVPFVEAVTAASGVVISIDTYRAEVARAAIEAGADVINDTSGLWDPGLADVAAATGATLVITHSLARPPRTPVPRPRYGDVVAEVRDFLADRVALALSHGVRSGQIIVDPGHDLNKNTLHSLEITRRLDEISTLGMPLLVAVSNKDFIGETLDLPQGSRVEGTLASLAVCILKGARVVRVHEVTPAVRAVRMTEAILGLRAPVYAIHNTGVTNEWPSPPSPLA